MTQIRWTKPARLRFRRLTQRSPQGCPPWFPTPSACLGNSWTRLIQFDYRHHHRQLRKPQIIQYTVLYYIVGSGTRKIQRNCSPFHHRGQPLVMSCKPSESRASSGGTPRQVRSRSRGRFLPKKAGRCQTHPWHRTSSFASPPPR